MKLTISFSTDEIKDKSEEELKQMIAAKIQEAYLKDFYNFLTERKNKDGH